MVPSSLGMLVISEGSVTDPLPLLFSARNAVRDAFFSLCARDHTERSVVFFSAPCYKKDVSH